MGKKYIAGIDIGTSSTVLALEDTDGTYLGSVNEPDEDAPQCESREIVPDGYVQNTLETFSTIPRGLIRLAEKFDIPNEDIIGVGIGARMHELVIGDGNFVPISDSLMWNFGASDAIRQQAMVDLPEDRQKELLFGYVGNFWGPKIKWASENVVGFEKYAKHLMLMGNFTMQRLTGEWSMSRAAASETLLFNPTTNDWADEVLEYFSIPRELLPPVHENLSLVGKISPRGALETILNSGTPVVDVGGDQHVAALGKGAYKNGHAAFEGGSSGVEFVVTSQPLTEERSRVNTFIHSVPSVGGENVYGLLACLSAAGQFYAKLKADLGIPDFKTADQMVSGVGYGKSDLVVLPYAFGPERVFENKGLAAPLWVPGGREKYTPDEKLRAGLEAITSWYKYASELVDGMGARIEEVRVANSGLFKNDEFCTWIATLLEVPVNRYNTCGARGAIKGARVAILGESLDEAYRTFTPEMTFEPADSIKGALVDMYGRNLDALKTQELIQ